MNNRRYEQLARAAAEIETLERTPRLVSTSAGCVPLARLAELARPAARTTPAERTHLAGCRTCMLRLRAFARPAAPSAWQRLVHPGGAWRSIAAAGLAACLLLTLMPRPAARGPRVGALHVPPTVRIVPAGVSVAAMPDCTPCDANCDGVVDDRDVEAFMLAMTAPERYASEYPQCNAECSVDLNCDGHLDVMDILPFAHCLVRG
jgi:hypothetical protein